MALALTAGGALADSTHHRGGAGSPGAGRGADAGAGAGHDMMSMMMRMHNMMGADGAMPGKEMMGQGAPMMGGMRGIAGMGMMAELDENGDGTVTPEEARTALSSLLAEYDLDGDGTLSLDEFESLHSARIRETMVDRFQHLDADGDGAVTDEEMQAAAQQMQRMQAVRTRMQAMRSRMMDDGGDGPGEMTPDEGRMMDGSNPQSEGQQSN